jgi:hypothetical protein
LLLVGDGVVIAPVDVHFEVIWRTQGEVDTGLASFQHADAFAKILELPF